MLRANGRRVENVKDFPFVLSLSKHESQFFSTLLGEDKMRHEFKLNCISCGHTVLLDENVYADYDGQIKCNACSAILSVKVEDGKLKFMDFVKLSKPSVEESFMRR